MLIAAAWLGAPFIITKSVPSPRASATHPAAHLVHTPPGTPFSLTDPTWITAIATGVLAVFAIVTAVYAILAFRKQAQEVRDQASMLKIQAGQLDAQRTPA
jgi:hypothetical protein